MYCVCACERVLVVVVVVVAAEVGDRDRAQVRFGDPCGSARELSYSYKKVRNYKMTSCRYDYVSQ